MTKIGKLWTGAVAYVSLLVGAGLSVAGNLADTYRVRGQLTDAVDIALAVGPPLATLLVAELFVSAWPRKLSVQSVRWVSTLVVGLLATVVSWLHINELLTARGQLTLVAILWPIAIDGLAIMAMAKILVMRADSGQRTAAIVHTPWPDTVDPVMAVDSRYPDAVNAATDSRWTDDGHGHAVADCPDPVATRPLGDLKAWQAGHEAAIDRLSADMATEAEQFLATVTNIRPDMATDNSADTHRRQPAARTRTADSAVPADVVMNVRLIADTLTGRTRADYVRQVATANDVSDRTARRWISAALDMAKQADTDADKES